MTHRQQKCAVAQHDRERDPGGYCEGDEAAPTTPSPHEVEESADRTSPEDHENEAMLERPTMTSSIKSGPVEQCSCEGKYREWLRTPMAPMREPENPKGDEDHPQSEAAVANEPRHRRILMLGAACAERELTMFERVQFAWAIPAAVMVSAGCGAHVGRVVARAPCASGPGLVRARHCHFIAT